MSRAESPYLLFSSGRTPRHGGLFFSSRKSRPLTIAEGRLGQIRTLLADVIALPTHSGAALLLALSRQDQWPYFPWAAEGTLNATGAAVEQAALAPGAMKVGPMTTTPPDWYPDPEDPTQNRYWDGTAWTDHRRPVETQPHSSGAPSPDTQGTAIEAQPLPPQAPIEAPPPQVPSAAAMKVGRQTTSLYFDAQSRMM